MEMCYLDFISHWCCYVNGDEEMFISDAEFYFFTISFANSHESLEHGF